MNTICLIVDRLHSGFIGAYGNTWIETPSLDRLASESFLFDQMLIDTPQLPLLYRSYLYGCHAMIPGCPRKGEPTLPELLARKAVVTSLLTDSSELVAHPLAATFDELYELDTPTNDGKLATSIGETHLASCFAQLIDRVESAADPFFLWCHLDSLGTLWDAPYEFRDRYAEEEDPPPPETADVPKLYLAEDEDPDRILGITQSYAGQVTLFDACIGALMEFLQESPCGEDTLLVLLSSRGISLGEHRHVGCCDENLHSELLHVPLMFRFPDRSEASARSQALVEPSDLHATLLDFHQIAEAVSPSGKSLLPLMREEMETIAHRDRLATIDPSGQRAFRTPAWFFLEGKEPQLYVKPDDYWEVNDVADRCHDVVERLHSFAAEYEQHVHSPAEAELSPLDEILLDGLK